MKATFCVPFEHGPFVFLDNEERDRITSWGRVGVMPLADVPTSIVLVETDAATMDELKAHSDYLWLEDVA